MLPSLILLDAMASGSIRESGPGAVAGDQFLSHDVACDARRRMQHRKVQQPQLCQQRHRLQFQQYLNLPLMMTVVPGATLVMTVALPAVGVVEVVLVIIEEGAELDDEEDDEAEDLAAEDDELDELDEPPP
ncbi:hypothetical protein KCV07_g402, partial [Aureobasidium melanogenum]